MVALINAIEGIIARGVDDRAIKAGLFDVMNGTARLLAFGQWGRLDVTTLRNQLDTISTKIGFVLKPGGTSS